MAKRSVDAFNPTGIEFDRRFYSNNQISTIIAAGGGLPDGEIEHTRIPDDGSDFVTVFVSRREALEERLESAALAWHVARQWETKPTAVMKADEYDALAAECTAVLKVLRLSPNKTYSDILEGIPTSLRRGGLQAFAEIEAQRLGGMPVHSGAGLLRDAVVGVQRLHRWAVLAAARERRRPPTPPHARHVSDTALDGLYGALLGIWIDVFDQLPTVTTEVTTKEGSPETVKGRFIDFMTASFAPLFDDETPTPTAIRRRVQKLVPSISPMTGSSSKKS